MKLEDKKIVIAREMNHCFALDPSEIDKYPDCNCHILTSKHNKFVLSMREAGDENGGVLHVCTICEYRDSKKYPNESTWCNPCAFKLKE